MSAKRKLSFSDSPAPFYPEPEEFVMPKYAAKSMSKRRRVSGYSRKNYAGVLARVPRGVRSNSCIIARVVNYDADFTSDVGRGFGFGTANLWVNGVATTAIPGAAEISALFDIMRVVKVECMILPGNNTLDYGINTITTGQRQLPYVYDCYDCTDSTNPSLSDVQQSSSCQIRSLDKVIRRTIYPRIKGSASIIETGSQSSTFIEAGIDTSANGWKVYIDLAQTVYTYDILRFSFKIYYDCRSTK